MTQTANGDERYHYTDKPFFMSSCPKGLEKLINLDKIFIVQDMEAQNRNEHQVLILDGQEEACYTAVEEYSACMRMCCSNQHSFTIHLLDERKNEVLRMVRTFKCASLCCWYACMNCCADEIRVEFPADGKELGSLERTHCIWNPKFKINDEYGETVLKIIGQTCLQTVKKPGDFLFSIVTLDGKCIGRINRRWPLWDQQNKNIFQTNLQMEFPVDLDVKTKAMLIAAAILFKVMFYEPQVMSTIAQM